MNPVQLAKLNGPKTEVADNIKQYPLTPDEMLPPVRKGNIIKGLGPNGTDIYSIDVGDMPDGMEFKEFIKLRKEEIDIEEGLKAAKLGVIDFHQTPPEWITTKVGDVSVTYLDAPPIGVGPATVGFVQVVGDDTPIPGVTYTSTLEGSVIPQEAKPYVSLPRTKKKKHRR